MFERINIFDIFRKHVKTLYDYGELAFNHNHKMPFSDIFAFLIFPFFVSFILVVPLRLYISENYLNVIITSLSIFVGLLFSLLTLVFDTAKKDKEKILNFKNDKSLRDKLLIVKELFINIAFAIALSILTIMVTILTRFNPSPLIQYLQKLGYYSCLRQWYLWITNVIAIYLILLFLMTLLMILKRFFLIYTNEFKEDAE